MPGGNLSAEADPGTGFAVEGKWPLRTQIEFDKLSLVGENLMPSKVYASPYEEFMPAQEKMIGKIIKIMTRMSSIKYAPV
jgi:hypothetical protein